MAYQAHVTDPGYLQFAGMEQRYAENYKPFDLKATVESAMRFANDMTLQQEKIKQVQVESALDQQLAPLKVAEAKLHMDRLQRENEVFALTNAPEQLQAQLDLKKSKMLAEKSSAALAIKTNNHTMEAMALDENGTFAHFEDLAMNNPSLALEQINEHKNDTDIAKNPIAMRKMNQLAQKARENLLTGNYDSLTMSQADRDKADSARFEYGKNALRSRFLASGYNPQQADEAVKMESEKIDDAILVGLLGNQITKEKIKMQEFQPPELAALSKQVGADKIEALDVPDTFLGQVFSRAAGNPVAQWNQATTKILDKINDDLIEAKASGRYDKMMIAEKMKRVKGLRNNWAWTSQGLFDTTEGAKINEYQKQFAEAKNATEKNSVLVSYAKFLGQFSMNYNIELMNERRDRAKERSGISPDSSTQGGATMSGGEPQFMTPDQVRAAPVGTMYKDDKGNTRRK